MRIVRLAAGNQHLATALALAAAIVVISCEQQQQVDEATTLISVRQSVRVSSALDYSTWQDADYAGFGFSQLDGERDAVNQTGASHWGPAPVKQLSAVESLFGQVAKAVVYGGAELARLNSRLLCSLLTFETEQDNREQPVLFAFNNPHNLERAYQIYSDDQITAEMLAEAEFDPEQMTLIFVHGWLGGIHNELWLTAAKNAALRASLRNDITSSSSNNSGGDWTLTEEDKRRKWTLKQAADRQSESGAFRPNVIVVEWAQFATGSLYSATQNSFKVSRRLGRLLGQLVQVGGMRAELMHCFGHSIGTHICGQAARRAFPAGGPHRMGRITGLDPGGFCYELGIKNETTYLGLKPSDAQLVDAYYSNRSPFGNKYQVAHYNVRLSNGYFQRACSVWRNPDVATKYFRAALQFFLGTTAHNDILTCDHYFATRFAHQLLPRACSYVAYACPSYRNFVRGQCGLCASRAHCYSMDFEYQRANASARHALQHIAAHTAAQSVAGTGSGEAEWPPGGVPYARRLVYYMQVADEEPYCSAAYRVRVQLNVSAVAPLADFRPEWIKLQLIGSEQEILKVRDGSWSNRRRRQLVHSIRLHGPWVAPDDELARREQHLAEYGLAPGTLTALFELAPETMSTLHLVTASGRFSEPPITDVIVVYDNEEHERRRRAPLPANPIEFIRIDYLSSADERIRSENSLTFNQTQFTLLYKHLRPETSTDIPVGG